MPIQTNTSIQLKRSGVTGNTPALGNLSLGELALNYAQGILYYSTGYSVGTIYTANSYSTINANSTLLTATTPTNILTLQASNTVFINGNSGTNYITIGVFDDVSNSASTLVKRDTLGGITTSNVNATYVMSNGVELKGYIDANITANTNVSLSFANSASSYANSAYLQANAAFTSQNTTGLYANTALQYANSAGSYANSAYSFANTVYSNYAYPAFIESQAAYNAQNTTGIYANTALQYANSAGSYANSAYLQANAAYLSQNTTGIYANTALQYANSAGSYANAAYLSQNTTGVYANTALQYANSAGSYANTALQYANSAGSYANSAYSTANTKFNSSGGTISGNTTIIGNLSVTGNIAFTGNVTNVTITGNSAEFFGSSNGAGALYAGVPTGYTLAPNAIAQFSGAVTSSSYLDVQNILSGSNATSDISATADNGSYNDTFIDMGITSSTYSAPGYGLTGPNDGYVYVTGNTTTGGGNLVLSTYTAKDIIFSQNGGDTSNEVARFKYNTGLVLQQFPITFADGTTQNSSSLSAGTYANAAFLAQNTTGIYANTALQYANSAGSYANSAWIAQNVTGGYANTALQYANSASSYANSAYLAQNTTGVYANTALQYANSAGSYANSAYLAQNTTGIYANTALQYANSAGSYANSAYSLANTVNNRPTYSNTNVASYLSSTYVPYSNTANVLINTDFTNGTYTVTIDNQGNVKLPTNYYNAASIGPNAVDKNFSIFAGSPNKTWQFWTSGLLNIPGDILGPTTVSLTNVFTTTTNTLYFGSNTSTLYVGGANTNVVVLGNITNNTVNSIYTQANAANILAQAGYNQANIATQEAVTSGSYANSAFLVANSAANFILIGTANAAFQAANSASSYANTGLQYANSASSYANSGYVQANLATQYAISAGTYANAAFGVANTAVQTISGTSGVVFANTSGTTVSINLVQSGVTAGYYGSPNQIPILNIDQFGRVLSAANTSITIPSGTTIVNTSQITANSGTGNVALTIANTGVTSGTYGSTTQSPVITVGSDGRISSIVNATISGGGGGSSNATPISFNSMNTANYIAIAAQTTFNIAYTVPYAMVYVNGVKMDPTEYTALTGTTIVLSTPAAANDIIDLIGYTTTTSLNYVLNISNTTPSTSNTTGALVVAGGLGVTGNVYAGTIYENGQDVIGTALAFAIALG